jgi:HsdM N-terminal domain
MTSNSDTLGVSALETWLWDAACEIRGPLDAPKFKDYILPLVFLKRLSDVFEDEVERLSQELGKDAQALVNADHKLVRFYIPEQARWSEVAKVTSGLGQYLTDAMRAVAKQNPKLQGVIDMVDFNATAAGHRIVDDQRLTALVQVLNRHRLGLADVDPDILGRAYEYLLRKFAEGQGQSAGELPARPTVVGHAGRLHDRGPGRTPLPRHRSPPLGRRRKRRGRATSEHRPPDTAARARVRLSPTHPATHLYRARIGLEGVGLKNRLPRATQQRVRRGTERSRTPDRRAFGPSGRQVGELATVHACVPGLNDDSQEPQSPPSGHRWEE